VLGFEALCLGNPWNTGLARIRAVMGSAKDLGIVVVRKFR
jgi:hypothetical protein